MERYLNVNVNTLLKCSYNINLNVNTGIKNLKIPITNKSYFKTKLINLPVKNEDVYDLYETQGLSVIGSCEFSGSTNKINMRSNFEVSVNITVSNELYTKNYVYIIKNYNKSSSEPKIMFNDAETYTFNNISYSIYKPAGSYTIKQSEDLTFNYPSFYKFYYATTSDLIIRKIGQGVNELSFNLSKYPFNNLNATRYFYALFFKGWICFICYVYAYFRGVLDE